jgi:pyruvate formate lyase activating enzyme
MKLARDDEHERWTGASNAQIIANASTLDPERTAVRVPLIPGVTDTDENVRGIYEHMRRAGLKTVELLPHNPSSPAKYEWLGLRYQIEGEPQDDEHIERLERMASEYGVTPIRHR